MNRTWATAILLMFLFVGALALRLPKLDLRPMHTDEAVQADKSGTLLKTGRYVYNPHEFHGPSLHFLALPSMWLSGGTYEACTERTFRIVPAILGGLLILLLWMLKDALGAPGMLCAAALLAVSPSMVFYNRYYIAETPLIFGNLLTLGAAWRYFQAPSHRWAALTGLGLAMMYTTKETWVFNVAAAFGALAAMVLWNRVFGKAGATPDSARNAPSPNPLPQGEEGIRQPVVRLPAQGPALRRHAACALAVFATVGVLLFSSFFTNLRGVWDSVETYIAWGRRATGENPHIQPWYYFLKLLAYNMNLDPGQFLWKFLFTEAFVLALACVGACTALTRWNPAGAHAGWVRFLTLYTALLATVYSVIPYKTPWCVLGFHLGFLLLGGVGAASIVAGLLRLRPKALAGLLAGLACVALLAGWGHLGLQACRTNFDPTLVAHRRNPYVYAHTNADAIRMARRIEELAMLSPLHIDAPVLVVAPGNDYWPLPYYLRHLKRSGFTDRVPENWRRMKPAVFACLDDPESGDRIPSPEGYVLAGFFGLRPAVNFAVYTQPGIWEAFQAQTRQATRSAK